ncbi:Cyclin-like F-box [Cordyceps fumosorosea ARSEF 2679]|uniref:Cyclin-like F-box n=1 Tax=Cordyceps fumosorosea (strain ARSEF 2679) TaxID=1081104 RepID=A0A162J1B6_CORFA|nr:Cyclin-like F-box [Cordyceps fumosorosea ARSEF 2679]OAA62352.1 Cyclin-like F-box [Cordyceps fumosorosea ARSEF 2679]
MSAGGDEASAAVPGSAFRFTDLPIETQRHVLSCCSSGDLICVALVSKHLHDLASAIMYRDFHIIFPDDDDLSFDSPVDGLAGGLDTFTTSQYDYARHLRDLSMDTLSSGIKGERSYQPYLYSSSCGKFFNTLLFLTLQKAHFLESFRWNVRIELSRPVYRRLRQLKSLRTLHIRMQAGDSYYSRPPPLPISFHQHHSPPSPVYGHSHWSNTAFPPLQSSMASPHPISHHVLQNEPHTRSRSVSKNRTPKQPQDAMRLSGFKNLKNLAVLDIDDMNVVTEIADSVKHSHSTLTQLKLSLSRSLASQARRASHESDAEESTDEDFPDPPNAHPPNFAPPEPVRNFRAQEEWKKQEVLLGKILGVEPSLHKKPQMNLDAVNVKAEESSATKPPALSPGQEFIISLTGISSKLVTLLHGPKELSATHQEILNTIEQAARKYVESGEMPSLKQNQDADKQTDGDEDNEAQPSFCFASTSAATNSETVGNADTANPLDNSNKLPLRQKLEDIPSSHSTLVDSPPDAGQLRHTGSRDELPSAGPSTSRSTYNPSVEDSARRRRDNVVPSRDLFKGNVPKSNDSQMNDYLRSTRGLSLEVLKIDLLPAKASVLCRALNLGALKELALLNVGNQAPIWTALAKENAVNPLPLRSIFTDNVSNAFLTFASGLEELHELFLLERSVDHLPASFTPRASVTIDQIRRIVLKKHIHTLKRLMIKDESKEANWDINEKTMVMICNLGVQLEELAISMNRNAVHVFMQYFHELVNLRAINILHFKSNDTCLWVVRETLRFMVDNLSHYPDMKLEWIAMEDDRVDRVVRQGEPDDEDELCPRRLSRAEQQLQHPVATGAFVPTLLGPLPPSHPTSIQVSNAHLPLFPPDAVGLDDSDDSDDERLHESGSRLRYTTVGPMQFYDVWGIKIFEKEIRSGRL